MKLAIKGLCALIPVILIWIYTWRNPLGFMDQEAPYYLWNKEKTNTVQEKKYRNVILGDSTANAAYVPELLSDDTINLALGGATPVENYYILEEWLGSHPAPDTCFISFADIHFRQDECFWSRTMFTHRFPMRVNFEILRSAVKYEEKSIVSGDYVADFISYGLYLPNKYITSLMNAGFNQRYGSNILAQQSNDLHAGRYIARGTGEYNPKETIVQSEFYVTSFFDGYYRRILQLCMDHDIQVRIMKLPLPENKVFTEKYQAAFYEYYGNIKEMYPEITVDWIPSYESSYFADENHMNSHGALQFSNEIKKIYQADFDESRLSLEQVAGINDSIAEENKIEQMVKWIAGKDYTIILSDTAGKFADICGGILEHNHLKLYQLDSGQLADGSTVSYISGMNNSNAGVVVSEAEGGLVIELNNKESRLWVMQDPGTLNAAVVDNYNHQIVCLKTFKYIEGGYWVDASLKIQ